VAEHHSSGFQRSTACISARLWHVALIIWGSSRRILVLSASLQLAGVASRSATSCEPLATEDILIDRLDDHHHRMPSAPLPGQ
jgi:hypothetical protein